MNYRSAMPKLCLHVPVVKKDAYRQHLLYIWRQLRKPFTLPPNSKALHVCRWEFIDIDLVACKICGEEHKCGIECENSVETDDGMICEVTGVCVKSHSFATSEYTDTVNVYGTDSSLSTQIEQRYSYIQQYVNELLLSCDARRISELQYKRSIDKYHQDIMRRMKMSMASTSTVSSTICWLDIIQWGGSLYQTCAFDAPLRQSIALSCIRILQRVICIVTTHLGLRIKDSELRGFVFGLMFLMRSGVCMQGINILPCYTMLKNILPSEAFMTEFRFFRAKYITDTENRFKFVFRQQPKARLQVLFNSQFI